MSTLVSVVIPTYNYGRFVARAIDSVLAQSYSPIECIVVDDGSTDDTPQVLARYGDRIRVIRQENRGLSAARNVGIRAARGGYIGLLDADDRWKPDKTARQVAVLEAEPAVGAVGCAVEITDEISPPQAMAARRIASHLPGRLRGIALRSFWVEGSGSGALIPRGVFDVVGLFDEELRAAEDWDMWLRIAACYPIINLTEVLVVISNHGTGTFRNADKMERNQWKVYEAAVARWPDMLDARTRRCMRALILADAGCGYLEAKQYDKALQRYFASVCEWPLEPSRWRRIAHLTLKQLHI